MVVPVWLGYSMLTALSAVIVLGGLFLLSILASLILDEIIPRIWLCSLRVRFKKFDEEAINVYLDGLYDYWEDIQRKENIKRGKN